VRDYNAGDNKAVYNPDGPDLVVVRNGTVGAVPQPGDVVSVGRTPYDSFGHTAVVTANAVDREGNGTITLIQQNGGAGNNGWVSYPVDKWVVGYGVTSWLHNPSWTAQWPLVGYNGPEGFEARVAAPGNSYEPIVSGATSIAVAGDIGSGGANGEPIYGYLDQNGEFRVRRASSPTWSLVATRVQSMALAETASGSPVLGFLSKAGDFYAEAGSLRSHFTLEARGVASIALAGGGGTASPLLGFVQSKTNAFLVKLGVAGNSWTVAQPWGVRSIALAEGTTASSLVLGYLSTDGSFLAKVGSGAGPWTKEATGASNISVAAIGPTGAPLLGYLARGAFYAAEAVAPSSWTKAASGVADMAVAAGSSAGALPVLSYLTMTGTLELMQGRIGRSFSLQAHGVSSMVISSVTDS